MNSCCASGVTGDGPTNTGVMIIGIAPGQQEVKLHKPFQGPSGQLLDAVLEAVGWSRDRTYCTNICCTFHNEPTPEQLAACAPRLHAEIRACAASAPNRRLLIIALGKIPSEYLFHMQFGKIQGAMLNFSDLYGAAGTQVVGLSSFHPSGILQSNDKPDQQNDFATSLVYDLEKIVPFVEGTSWTNGFAGRLEGHIKPGDFELINNPTRAQALLDEDIDATRSVVIDIETDYDKDAESADPYGNILCVGLRYTDSHSGVRSIAVITQAGLEGIEWPNGLRYVGHYLYGFDSIAMQVKFGAKIPTVGDTYVKSYVKDERTRRGLHKLKNRSRELCLHPDTRVLTADLRWIPIKDVQVSDRLVGFNEQQLFGEYRKLEPSVVIGKHTQILERYAIFTDCGDFIASPEHMWLAKSQVGQGQGKRYATRFMWRGTSTLQPGDRIARLCTPWSEDQSLEAAYLAGFFDGEGSVSYSGGAKVTYSQLGGCVNSHVQSLLTAKGFNVHEDAYYQENGKIIGHYSILGATREAMRFIGQIRPIRLVAKAESVWSGFAPMSTNHPVATVIGIQKLEDGELVALQTSTNTFIAEGLLSHNCGAGFYEDEREHQAGMSLYTYNANDVYYTDVLDEELEKRFDDTDRRLYYDLLLPSANMYSDSQLKGANIDQFKLGQVSAEFIQQMHSLEAELIAEALADQFYGNHTGIFNLNSPMQVLAYLRKRGHKIDSTGKDIIEFLTIQDIDGQHIADPWVGKLLKYRRYVKAHAVYCVGTQRNIKFDHYVHPQVLIPGTRTGRPSIINPPVNTLPHTRSIGELSIVRAMYVPDDPDNDILMEFDYSQIELYILQWLSGDLNLLEDIYEPWHVTGKPNYHSRTCELIIGGVVCPTHGVDTIPSCAICRKWEFDRDAQKHVNFGIPYGESAMGLMRPPPIGTGQSLEVCQSYINAWYDRNTEVLKWQRRTQQELVDHGEVQTAFGRKFRTPLVCNAKQLRQIINAPVQSTASDYTLTAALELKDKLKRHDARMLWTTYDSILLNVPERNAQDVANLVVSVMTKPRTPGGPSVPVEYKAGKNLYEVSEVH
jgi:uracil-DNA glycosylase family 4